ncbi:unnamed protein product, partial [Protopolystoma xenopodis]
MSNDIAPARQTASPFNASDNLPDADRSSDLKADLCRYARWLAKSEPLSSRHERFCERYPRRFLALCKFHLSILVDLPIDFLEAREHYLSPPHDPLHASMGASANPNELSRRLGTYGHLRRPLARLHPRHDTMQTSGHESLSPGRYFTPSTLRWPSGPWTRFLTPGSSNTGTVCTFSDLYNSRGSRPSYPLIINTTRSVDPYYAGPDDLHLSHLNLAGSQSYRPANPLGRLCQPPDSRHGLAPRDLMPRFGVLFYWPAVMSAFRRDALPLVCPYSHSNGSPCPGTSLPHHLACILAHRLGITPTLVTLLFTLFRPVSVAATPRRFGLGQIRSLLQQPIPDHVVNNLLQLMDHLDRPEYLRCEGIFRKTGNVLRQRELRRRLLSSEPLDLSKLDPLASEYPPARRNGRAHVGAQASSSTQHLNVHDLAAGLKSVLYDLSEPLLTHELLPVFVQVASKPIEERIAKAKQLKALRILHLLLPQPHLCLWTRLLCLLRHTLAFTDNRMTPDSLGTLFGPLLLAPGRVSPFVQTVCEAFIVITAPLIASLLHVALGLPAKCMQSQIGVAHFRPPLRCHSSQLSTSHASSINRKLVPTGHRGSQALVSIFAHPPNPLGRYQTWPGLAVHFCLSLSLALSLALS